MLKNAQKEIKKQADRYREEVEKYKVGNMVLLNTKGLKWQMVRRRIDKLIERFVGPYRIKKVISTNAVELELPEPVRIYPVINISRVHRYREQVVGQKVVPSPPVIIEGK